MLTTLTLNGITKLVDDQIILDSRGQPFEFQWTSYQLEYVCTQVGIDLVHPLTGLKRTNHQMSNALHKRANDVQEKLQSITDEELKKHGLWKANIKNKIDAGNWGSFSIRPVTTQTKEETRVAKRKRVVTPSLSPIIPMEIEKPMKQGLKIGLLTYGSNSCFIDSFLMAIMHRKGNPMIEYILDAPLNPIYKKHAHLEQMGKTIQKELKSLYEQIHRGENASVNTLRQEFKKFDDDYRQKIASTKGDINRVGWLSSQDEPTSVCEILSKILKLGGLLKREQKTSTNPPYNTFDVCSIQIDVEPTQKKLILSTRFPIETNTVYNETSKTDVKTTVTYKSRYGYLISFRRASATGKLTYKVKVEDQITINNIDLELVSIVVHSGETINSGHYTLYLLHDGLWYHYDGIGPVLRSIGRFNQIPQDAFCNCTTLVYLPKVLSPRVLLN